MKKLFSIKFHSFCFNNILILGMQHFLYSIKIEEPDRCMSQYFFARHLIPTIASRWKESSEIYKIRISRFFTGSCNIDASNGCTHTSFCFTRESFRCTRAPFPDKFNKNVASIHQSDACIHHIIARAHQYGARVLHFALNSIKMMYRYI